MLAMPHEGTRPHPKWTNDRLKGAWFHLGETLKPPLQDTHSPPVPLQVFHLMRRSPRGTHLMQHPAPLLRRAHLYPSSSPLPVVVGSSAGANLRRFGLQRECVCTCTCANALACLRGH